MYMYQQGDVIARGLFALRCKDGACGTFVRLWCGPARDRGLTDGNQDQQSSPTQNQSSGHLDHQQG